MDGNTCSIRKSITDLVLGAQAASTTTETAVTVTGARVGDAPIVTCRQQMPAGLFLCPGRVSANDTVQVTIGNITGAPIDPADTFDFDIEIIRATGAQST